MNDNPNNPLDYEWDHDDFGTIAGSDDEADLDLWHSDPLPDDFGSPEYDLIGFDEPEPEDGFIGGLSQTLHVPDDGIRNMGQTLELDKFLAQVADMTDCQRRRIENALLGFSASRRANWLRWMKLKKWTGKSLLLFLRFYDLWINTPTWWERFYRSAYSSGILWSYYNRGALSRDRCYVLVHRRIDQQPRKIIEKSWLEDWHDFDLWRYGFDSFASFAIFRAELSPDEDWWDCIGFGSLDESHDYELRDWRIYLEWWTDMSDWHDNLISDAEPKRKNPLTDSQDFA